MIVVGTGPSELHAHIDVEHRARTRLSAGTPPRLTVLAASEHHGQWSVVAELHPPRKARLADRRGRVARPPRHE